MKKNLFILLLLCVPGVYAAQELQISLELSDTDAQYIDEQGAPFTVNSKAIMFFYSEAINSHLSGSLIGGYHDNDYDPGANSGRSLTGPTFGINLEGYLWHASDLKIHLIVDFRYVNMEDRDENDFRLRYYRWAGGANVHHRLHNKLSWYVQAMAIDVDGKSLHRNNADVDFTSKEDYTAEAGILYHTDAEGALGIKYAGGQHEGFALVFMHYYQ